MDDFADRGRGNSITKLQDIGLESRIRKSFIRCGLIWPSVLHLNGGEEPK